MDKPTLHGTPLSHFTRKIRILLAELCVDFDFVRASSVLAISQASYADNPLMRVPTLVHAGTTVIDSEHIARYLVATYDPKDNLRRAPLGREHGSRDLARRGRCGRLEAGLNQGGGIGDFRAGTSGSDEIRIPASAGASSVPSRTFNTAFVSTGICIASAW